MTSCSTGNTVIDSDTNLPKKIFKNQKNLVFHFTDERKTDYYTILNYNNSNIRFAIPIAQYAENYFNRSVSFDSVSSNVKKVDVFIDQLRFEDYKSLKYSLRFSIPFSEDTSVIFRIASNYFKEDQKKLKDGELIDFALTEIIDSFFAISENLATNNTGSSSYKNIVVTKSFNDKEEDLSSNNILLKEEPTVEELKIENTYSEKTILSSFGLALFFGDKIENGFQLSYSTGRYNAEGKFVFSIGAGLLYYSINNKKDLYKGFLFSGAFPIPFQYFLSGYESGVFFGAAFKLTTGQEKIDYGYEEKTGFFFGPTFEPYIGIKVLNAFSLDAGYYLLKHFGSIMLSEDTGAKFNMNIWF